MDQRRKGHFGFLGLYFAGMCLSLLLCGSAFGAKLYVRTDPLDCGLTRLRISIEKLSPLPNSVMLTIKDGNNKSNVLGPVQLTIENNTYNWVGLLPFAKYWVAVQLPSNNESLTDSFTNVTFYRQFLGAASRAVIIRNGKVGDAPDRDPIPPQSIRISVGPFPEGTKRIYLLLIDQEANRLVAHYLGSPVSEWEAEAPDGSYKLVSISYPDTLSKCEIKGSASG